MRHDRLMVAAGALGLLLVSATAARAQDWSPPSRQMPAMQVGAGWQGSLASWFLPGTSLDAVRAQGEGGFIRFTAGPRPVAAWTDRNGDGRADMLQIFRGGAVAYQVVDADLDGSADVVRIYDQSGALASERRL